MKRLMIGLVSVLVLLLAAFDGWGRWVNAHRIEGGPRNESAFYQSYNPEQVIKEFRYEGENHGEGHGRASVQLIKSIQHTQEFTPTFTMHADQRPDLMKALRDDVATWLRITRTTVVASHERADGGFMIRYVAGDSIGSISVQPPVRSPVSRQYVLAKGLEDVVVEIDIEETWKRPANETRWWMAAVD